MIKIFPNLADQLFFRKMAVTSKAARTGSLQRFKLLVNLSNKLQEDLEFPPLNLPVHPNSDDYRKISNSDIENLAKDCRQRWGIQDGSPIVDLLLALENVGVVVVREEISLNSNGVDTIDGFSDWDHDKQRPYIFLSKNKQNCVRSRFDAAHEFGHIILHKNLDKKFLNDSSAFKEIELQAHYFAGALLLPEESFLKDVEYPDLERFRELKSKWRVSIAAMIKRCEALHQITEFDRDDLWKSYTRRGWRRHEPLDDSLLVENPRLLGRSIKLLIESKRYSKIQLLNRLNLCGHDVESLCNLPEGYLDESYGRIVEFPVLRANSSPRIGNVSTSVQQDKKENVLILDKHKLNNSQYVDRARNNDDLSNNNEYYKSKKLEE